MKHVIWQTNGFGVKRVLSGTLVNLCVTSIDAIKGDLEQRVDTQWKTFPDFRQSSIVFCQV